MRNLLGWVLLIAVVVLGVYYGSPYYTVWRLTQAAKAGDVNAVAKIVDFPEVRASLSPDLSAKLQASIDRGKAQPHGILDRIGMFLAPVLSGGSKETDSLLTPTGVTVIVKTAHAPNFQNPFRQLRPTDRSDPGQPVVVNEGYVEDDLDRFQTTIQNKLAPGPRVQLKLIRSGFLTWKVTALDLQTAGAATTTRTTTTHRTTTSSY